MRCISLLILQLIWNHNKGPSWFKKMKICISQVFISWYLASSISKEENICGDKSLPILHPSNHTTDQKYKFLSPRFYILVYCRQYNQRREYLQIHPYWYCIFMVSYLNEVPSCCWRNLNVSLRRLPYILGVISSNKSRMYAAPWWFQ